jgi:hypothetical protein
MEQRKHAIEILKEVLEQERASSRGGKGLNVCRTKRSLKISGFQ